MTLEEFEDEVDEALESLPDDIAAMMDNIDVVVEDHPTREQMARAGLPRGSLLLGLYTGVPLGRRGQYYGGVVPDRVIIFKRNIEKVYDREHLHHGIRSTVLHEIGHHFGLSDARLRELGY